ncbi:MAG: hypothetical protein JW881_17640 [Spirochaetales bacterium]|nr:hypothetical protein [Spirochaetales bacterium]
MKNKSIEGICEMCGHYVMIRQKAHIIAEGLKNGDNLLMLCPSCHSMFDIHLKPKMYKALDKASVKNLPVSWKNSIYFQAAEASQKARQKKKN